MAAPDEVSTETESVETAAIRTPTAAELQAWEEEFRANYARPLEVRMKYSFIKTYKPVLDDADFRSFDSMAEYRQWCEENLPSWLGYGRV